MSEEAAQFEGLTEEEQAALNEYAATDGLAIEPEQTEVEAGPKEPAESQPEAPQETQPELSDKERALYNEVKEERRKRQEADQKLSVLMERTNYMLSQIDRATAPEQPEVPTLEEDPVGHLSWQVQQLQEQLRSQGERSTQAAKNIEQTQAVHEFNNYFNARVEEYKTVAPDYQAAADYLIASRRKELEVLGIRDQAAQDKAMQDESMMIALNAAQMGQNHAEIFYEMAKLRGYQPSATQGTTAPNAPPVTPNKLEVVRRGQQAAQSLSNVGGSGSGSYELTAQSLIEMTDDEFREATKGDKWRKLHGG